MSELLGTVVMNLHDDIAFACGDLEAFNRLANGLPREVELRARHVIEEIDRTQRAVPLLLALGPKDNGQPLSVEGC